MDRRQIEQLWADRRVLWSLGVAIVRVRLLVLRMRAEARRNLLKADATLWWLAVIRRITPGLVTVSGVHRDEDGFEYIPMHDWALDQLSDYSLSNPSGMVVGKRWKRAMREQGADGRWQLSETEWLVVDALWDGPESVLVTKRHAVSPERYAEIVGE